MEEIKKFLYINTTGSINAASTFKDSLSLKPNLRIKYSLIPFSIILFSIFVIFLSLSVKKFVNNSISIALEPIQESYSNNIEEQNEISTVTVTVKRNDTLKSILQSQSLASADIKQIIKIFEERKLTSALKAGQKIIFDYEIGITEEDGNDLATESKYLSTITFNVNKINSIEISRSKDNEILVATDKSILLNKHIAKSSITINSNFVSALKNLKISTNNIVELTNAYRHQVDFQRQIKPGDKITVITEKFTNKNGDFFHHGKVLFASLLLSGKEYNIYRFSPDNDSNTNVFFSEEGKSVRRSLLRTPVNLIRVSSHFGHRSDPVHGYSAMHMGVDFAAAIGTPFHAAGDGIVTEIGWRSGYGNCIQIKHSPTLSTFYAHAKNFAANLKQGSIVKQGQVIAYVGRTGKTTGAHLHYEVKIGGKRVNPMSIKTTPDVSLNGKNLAKFQTHKQKFKSLSIKLDSSSEIAENDAVNYN